MKRITERISMARRKATKITKPIEYETQLGLVRRFGWLRHRRAGGQRPDYIGYTGSVHQNFGVFWGGKYDAIYPWHIKLFEGYDGDITQEELWERVADSTTPYNGVYRVCNLRLALADAIEVCKPELLVIDGTN